MSETTDRPWMDESSSAVERAESLVQAMSLEQKIQQLHGNMETIDIYGLLNVASTCCGSCTCSRSR